MSNTEPAATTSLAQLAYKRIRGDILQGELKPEEKLKIHALRLRYGTGASPLREALSQLTADGLVTRVEKRGFRVARANNDDLDELVQARCWIESQALRESMEHARPAWQHAVVIAIFELTRTPRSLGNGKEFLSNPEWERLHKRFHMALISGCGNRIVMDLCDQFYDRAVRYRALSIARYPTRDVPSEHQELADAALDRDPEKAVALLNAHYRRTATLLTAAPPKRKPK